MITAETRIHPEQFGLKGVKWAPDTRLVGSFVMFNTLRIGHDRDIKRLNRLTVDGRLAHTNGLPLLCVTRPMLDTSATSSSSPKYLPSFQRCLPVDEFINNEPGAPTLRKRHSGGSNMVNELAVGRADYYHVGPGMHAVIITANPDFDPAVARRTFEQDETADIRIVRLGGMSWLKRLLRETYFDPVEFIDSLPGHSSLEPADVDCGTSYECQTIDYCSHDLAVVAFDE
jgi:hypothetical protein